MGSCIRPPSSEVRDEDPWGSLEDLLTLLFAALLVFARAFSSSPLCTSPSDSDPAERGRLILLRRLADPMTPCSSGCAPALVSRLFCRHRNGELVSQSAEPVWKIPHRSEMLCSPFRGLDEVVAIKGRSNADARSEDECKRDVGGEGGGGLGVTMLATAKREQNCAGFGLR